MLVTNVSTLGRLGAITLADPVELLPMPMVLKHSYSAFKDLYLNHAPSLLPK